MASCAKHPSETIDSSLGLVCRACVAGLPSYMLTDPLMKSLKGLLGVQKETKRPFIEITRTKKIETQLTRIATALEQLLIEAYGYHTDIPTTDTSGPETQVMYTDHDEHDIQDILDDMKERK